MDSQWLDGASECGVGGGRPDGLALVILVAFVVAMERARSRYRRASVVAVVLVEGCERRQVTTWTPLDPGKSGSKAVRGANVVLNPVDSEDRQLNWR